MQITNRSLFLRSKSIELNTNGSVETDAVGQQLPLADTCSMWLEKRGSLASGGLKFCCSLRCRSHVFDQEKYRHDKGCLSKDVETDLVIFHNLARHSSHLLTHLFISIVNFFEQHAVTALAKTKRHSFTKSEKELVMMRARAPRIVFPLHV